MSKKLDKDDLTIKQHVEFIIQHDKEDSQFWGDRPKELMDVPYHQYPPDRIASMVQRFARAMNERSLLLSLMGHK